MAKDGSVLIMFDILHPGKGAWLTRYAQGVRNRRISGSAWRVVRRNDAGHLLEAQALGN